MMRRLGLMVCGLHKYVEEERHEVVIGKERVWLAFGLGFCMNDLL